MNFLRTSSLVTILQIHLYKELEGTCTFRSMAISDCKKWSLVHEEDMT